MYWSLEVFMDDFKSMRTKPYTAQGIKRKKCIRCGKQASYQWNICSLGKSYWPVCITCDILLNELVLDWLKWTDRKEIIKKYKEKINEIPCK
jgi:DTW domain-containing protein YfiP